MSRKYWEECVEAMLEDVGMTATPEQVKQMASVVEGAHENYGMAFGHDCIPNPTETEKDRQIKLLKDEIKRLGVVEDMFRKNVATRRGVDESDVEINTRDKTVNYRRML